MDFLSVPTVTFRALQVLFVIRHDRRDVVRCAFDLQHRDRCQANAPASTFDQILRR
jgi:hypothetical protein